MVSEFLLKELEASVAIVELIQAALELLLMLLESLLIQVVDVVGLVLE